MNGAVRIDFLIYPHHKMNSIGLISLCSFRMRWKTKKIQIYTTSICGCLCIRKRDLLFFFARLPLHAGWSLCKTSENILLRHKTDVQKKVQHNFYERSKSTWLNGWFCASANNSKANSKRFIQKAAVLFASLFTDRTYGL